MTAALSRTTVLLSFQCALWDAVTPELRGVAVRIGDAHVEGRMIYDHEPDEDEIETCSEVETYVIADFPDDVVIRLRAVAVVSPEPRNLLPSEEWVYVRKEPSPAPTMAPAPEISGHEFTAGEYRLIRVRDGVFHYAAVSVAARVASSNAVVVGTAPFAWRLDAYGPFANRLTTDTDEVDEAVDGVRHALAALPIGSGSFHVVVASIRTSMVDTLPGDVAYAAGHALWRAIGHERADVREVRAGRLVFPDGGTGRAEG